jgi:TRAP-type C4-dicarboxylate transport system permease small subunit
VSEPADGESSQGDPPAAGPAPAAAPAAAPGSGSEPASAAPATTAEAPSASLDVPPTRRQAVAEPSASAKLAAALSFPDDGPLAVSLRRFDNLLGLIEQGVVFGLLSLVVVVAAGAAIHDRFVADHLGSWWHYIVRGGTFSTAMFAAVYATQQQRHLAMDLVSRRLSPRGRLLLGIALKLLTIAAMVLFGRSGLHARAVVGGKEGLELFGLHIVDADIVATIAISAVLIGLHSLIHIAIDVEYLVRGKLPPERARSGH